MSKAVNVKRQNRKVRSFWECLVKLVFMFIVFHNSPFLIKYEPISRVLTEVRSSASLSQKHFIPTSGLWADMQPLGLPFGHDGDESRGSKWWWKDPEEVKAETSLSQLLVQLPAFHVTKSLLWAPSMNNSTLRQITQRSLQFIHSLHRLALQKMPPPGRTLRLRRNQHPNVLQCIPRFYTVNTIFLVPCMSF